MLKIELNFRRVFFFNWGSMFVAIPRSLQSFYTVIEAATIKYFIIFGLFNQNFYSRSVEDSIVELGLVEFQYIHYLLLYVSHFFLCLKISWTFQTAFELSLVYLDYFVRIWRTMFLYKSLLMLLYFCSDCKQTWSN